MTVTIIFSSICLLALFWVVLFYEDTRPIGNISIVSYIILRRVITDRIESTENEIDAIVEEMQKSLVNGHTDFAKDGYITHNKTSEASKKVPQRDFGRRPRKWISSMTNLDFVNNINSHFVLYQMHAIAIYRDNKIQVYIDGFLNRIVLSNTDNTYTLQNRDSETLKENLAIEDVLEILDLEYWR